MKKFLLILLAILLLFSTSCFALNLQDSVNTALNNNPDIMASLKKVNAAQGKVMGARGAFFPTVKLNASTGQVYQQPYLLEVEFSGQKLSGLAGYDNTIPMRSIDFTVTQPLFTGGKLLSGASLAHNQYMLAYNDYRKALLDVRYNTTSAYFGVIKAQKTVDLAVQSKTMAEEHLNQVKSMFDLGSVTKADYLRGEVQLANAEVGLTRAKNGLAIAKNSFNNILGLTTEADFDVNQDDLTYKISDLPSYDGLLEIAYKNRPEWQQFELSKDMANDSINLSRADMYPSIALIGTYKSAYSEYPGFFTDQRSWSAMVAGSWNIFDLKIQGNIYEARENLDASNASAKSLKNAIALDVKNSYLELKSAQEVIESTQKAQELADENYSVATTRYSAGAATNLEVIDAEVSLTQARLNHLQSQFDIKIAQAKLNKVVGQEVL